MTKYILTVLILINSILLINAQIYTPSETIQGPSGNNNVGIGTDNPEVRLTIKSTYAPWSFFASINALPSDGSSGGLYLGSISTSNAIIGSGGTYYNSGKWVSKGASLSAINLTNGSISFIGNDGLTPNQQFAPTTRMIISNSGNVGIGTTSPSYKLVVNGTISCLNGHLRNKSINTKPSSIDNIFDHASYDLIDLGGQAGSGNEITAIKLTTAIGETTFGSRLIQEDNLFRIQCGNGNSNPYSFLINGSTGNVGIGTNNPKAKLSVNGTIISNEIKVLADISQYPDFVFSENYNLRPIREVEKFILENKHLPEIPKANEIEEGIALGEMNTKLLQKIEELTLYTIEQQKQLDMQMEIIESLKHEIKEMKK